MYNQLKLKREISETTANIDSEDVKNVKKRLKELGHYKKEETDPIVDREMFEGIRSFQKKHKLQTDGIMKPSGETERKMNQILERGEGLSSAIQQGLSLGWADEAEGVIGGAVYGIGDKLSGRGEFGKGFERGYKKYRDQRRQVLENSYKKMPLASGIAEMSGAIGSPITFVKASPISPLKNIKRKNLLNAMVSGSVYGAGTSKNNAKDYATNIAIGALGGVMGTQISNKIYGRAGSTILRNVTEEGINQAANLLFSPIKKDKDKK